MVYQFKRREETEGCACLECRNVATGTTRRRLGDILLWAVGFLRTHPSVVAVFLLLAGAQFVGHLAPMAVELAMLPVIFVGGMFARGYTAMLAADSLSNETHTRGAVAKYTLRRLPAVFAIFALSGLVTIGLMMGIVALALFVLIVDTGWYVVLGISALLATFVLMIVVLVKFVLAAEAAVIGGYGPIASLRVSWGIISFRRRTTIVLIGLVVGLLFGVVVSQLSIATAPYPIIGNETVRDIAFGLSNATFFLSSAVTTLVFAHVYVRGVLE
ncbi:hypothetical protein D8Y22_08565 [Salinadaptatus halalkaliphilus]|uniref:DUF7847 domain-containing protein n=1 Tax=Salinadaptatus halalkaliphilus TaxID=2419781 RepID=A0A4S3TNL8_9EURY|nr:hypothetical protein [Salinadaptatus halalkaliphilus]THE65250.1 hypothetical protein D8Y22_08565 [Salinadaptatus halalkaliphilus]